MAKYEIYNIARQKELEETFEKYPGVPQLYILKTDICRRGVTFKREAIEKIQDPYYEHSPHILFQWHH